LPASLATLLLGAPFATQPASASPAAHHALPESHRHKLVYRAWLTSAHRVKKVTT
jgi:hypothetical protein